VSLAEQWRDLESALPQGWENARLRLRVRNANHCDRAAALMGPAQPYRVGQQELRFAAARDGSAPSPDGLVRLLARLDRERVIGTLELVGAQAAKARPESEVPSLAESWDAAAAGLPADWSDLYAEIELLSTDYIERGSLLCAPLNTRRDGDRAALRFRSARQFGYGASPGMVRRCLERCDADDIHGSVTILRVLCDTGPVATQGPVWQMSGNTV
jgi:hypothetical protein